MNGFVASSTAIANIATGQTCLDAQAAIQHAHTSVFNALSAQPHGAAALDVDALEAAGQNAARKSRQVREAAGQLLHGLRQATLAKFDREVAGVPTEHGMLVRGGREAALVGIAQASLQELWNAGRQQLNKRFKITMEECFAGFEAALLAAGGRDGLVVRPAQRVVDPIPHTLQVRRIPAAPIVTARAPTSALAAFWALFGWTAPPAPADRVDRKSVV